MNKIVKTAACSGRKPARGAAVSELKMRVRPWG